MHILQLSLTNIAVKADGRTEVIFGQTFFKKSKLSCQRPWLRQDHLIWSPTRQPFGNPASHSYRDRLLSLVELVFVYTTDLRHQTKNSWRKDEADILFVHCRCFHVWSCCRQRYVLISSCHLILCMLLVPSSDGLFQALVRWGKSERASGDW